MVDTLRLIGMAHEGDQKARDKLVLENTGLVWSIVKRFQGRGCEQEDLYQIGCIGLIKAIDHFDPGYDVKFSTYAVPMIMGEIRRFLRDDGMIKVSRSIKEMSVRVQRAREAIMWELGREPTLEEIAEKLSVSREEVAAAIEAGAEIESIDKTVGNGDDPNLRLMDRLSDEWREQEVLLNRMVLDESLSRLDPREREIIDRRYFKNQTQSEIAAEYHISQVQVSRLEKKILHKMKVYLDA
ncbi:MAG: SigF/SigG family RNA polymerase sporulation sigma factor [Clostridiales bacterium]|nr:SigF/SigG family RNA polymerase sporulation sigma factor [Clostridiales bacterium]